LIGNSFSPGVAFDSNFRVCGVSVEEKTTRVERVTIAGTLGNIVMLLPTGSSWARKKSSALLIEEINEKKTINE
jgi:hypothetical protein